MIAIFRHGNRIGLAWPSTIKGRCLAVSYSHKGEGTKKRRGVGVVKHNAKVRRRAWHSSDDLRLWCRSTVKPAVVTAVENQGKPGGLRSSPHGCFRRTSGLLLHGRTACMQRHVLATEHDP